MNDDSVQLDTEELAQLEFEAGLDGLRIAQGLGVYVLVGVLPVLAIGAGAAAKLVATVGLPPGERLVPGLDYGAIAALAAVLLCLVLGPLATMAVSLPRIRSSTYRLLFGLTLVTVHPFLVCMGAGTTLGAASPLVFGPISQGHADSPNGKERAYLFKKRGNNTCGWELYIGDKLDPVSTHQGDVICDCDHMPDADVVWQGLKPDLVDERGQPYSCPPPSTCATAGPAPGWLALLMATAWLRRRSRGDRGARSAPRPARCSATTRASSS